MQLQLNVNDLRANILLNFLDLFKKDNLINDYQVIDTQDKYNDYEKEILEDLEELKTSIYEEGVKTNKYIELN